MVMLRSSSFLKRTVCTPLMALTTVDLPCATCPIVPAGACYWWELVGNQGKEKWPCAHAPMLMVACLEMTSGDSGVSSAGLSLARSCNNSGFRSQAADITDYLQLMGERPRRKHLHCEPFVLRHDVDLCSADVQQHLQLMAQGCTQVGCVLVWLVQLLNSPGRSSIMRTPLRCCAYYDY